jgi:hypothetical protein
MFSAIDNRNQQRVILLDALDEASKERFRQEARDGFLHCPVCNQPVLVRFGTERRFHFAHKHLSNCPSSYESAELLQARAVLYRWLKGKFEGVTLEKQLESPALPTATGRSSSQGEGGGRSVGEGAEGNGRASSRHVNIPTDSAVYRRV